MSSGYGRADTGHLQSYNKHLNNVFDFYAPVRNGILRNEQRVVHLGEGIYPEVDALNGIASISRLAGGDTYDLSSTHLEQVVVLATSDINIRTAIDTVVRHVFTGPLKVNFGGIDIQYIFRSVLETIYTDVGKKALRSLLVYGFLAFKIRAHPVLIGIPEILDISRLRIRVKRDAYHVCLYQALTAKGVVNNDILFWGHTEPLSNGRLTSIVANLLPMWTRVQTMHLMHKKGLTTQAYPPLIVQRVPENAGENTSKKQLQSMMKNTPHHPQIPRYPPTQTHGQSQTVTNRQQGEATVLKKKPSPEEIGQTGSHVQVSTGASTGFHIITIDEGYKAVNNPTPGVLPDLFGVLDKYRYEVGLAFQLPHAPWVEHTSTRLQKDTEHMQHELDTLVYSWGKELETILNQMTSLVYGNSVKYHRVHAWAAQWDRLHDKTIKKVLTSDKHIFAMGQTDETLGIDGDVKDNLLVRVALQHNKTTQLPTRLWARVGLHTKSGADKTTIGPDLQVAYDRHLNITRKARIDGLFPAHHIQQQHQKMQAVSPDADDIIEEQERDIAAYYNIINSRPRIQHTVVSIQLGSMQDIAMNQEKRKLDNHIKNMDTTIKYHELMRNMREQTTQKTTVSHRDSTEEPDTQEKTTTFNKKKKT